MKSQKNFGGGRSLTLKFFGARGGSEYEHRRRRRRRGGRRIESKFWKNSSAPPAIVNDRSLILICYNNLQEFFKIKKVGISEVLEIQGRSKVKTFWGGRLWKTEFCPFPPGGDLGILADRYEDIFDFDTHLLTILFASEDPPIDDSFCFRTPTHCQSFFPNLTHLRTFFVVQVF